MPYAAKAVQSFYNCKQNIPFCASSEEGVTVEFTTKRECTEFCVQLNNKVVFLAHNQSAQTPFRPYWISAKKEARPYWAR